MLSVIAAVAVVAAVFMLAIKPKREEASELATQATQAQTRLDAALASLANAKQARARFAEAQVGIARLGKAVPTDEDTATIVYQLEQTARAAGINFRSLAVDAAGSNPTPASGAGTADPAGAAAFTKVPVQLKFTGSFFELRRFIDHVNSLTKMKKGKYVSAKGRLFSVDGVALDAAPTGFPQIVAKLVVTAYTAPAPDVAKPTTAAASGGTTTSAAAPGTTASSPTASANTPPSSEVAR
jgi:Tfp pilus assembly protein PilO